MLFFINSLLNQFDNVLFDIGFLPFKDADLSEVHFNLNFSNRVYSKNNMLFIVSISNSPETSLDCVLCFPKSIRPRITFFMEQKNNAWFIKQNTFYVFNEMVKLAGEYDVLTLSEPQIFYDKRDLKNRINIQVDFLKRNLDSIVQEFQKLII